MGLGLLPSAFALLAAAATAAPSASPSPSPSVSVTPVPPAAPIILFIIDNSASLPPLDPDEKRVAALEKMFVFLEGQKYRLILFGGRQEIFVDDVSRYRNNGQWTDFYFAYERTRDHIKEYPAGTNFRLVLLTDGLVDPNPDDWKDAPPPAGMDLKRHANARLLNLLREMKQPLYVVLVGVPPDGASRDQEQAPPFILEMVRAANGMQAAPMAQTLASFFGDNGLLLKKFVYRVKPQEGLRQVEPVVRRIVAPPKGDIEIRILTWFVLPMTIFLFVMLGLLVRSFPGPGDTEHIEINKNVPIHVAVDRGGRGEGGWSNLGLSLVRDAKDAAASFSYQAAVSDFGSTGLDSSGLDALSQRALPLSLTDLRRMLDDFARNGSKEEKIFSMNLDYVARTFDSAAAERILKMGASERRKLSALDYLRAKVHVLTNPDLEHRLTGARLQFVSYGKTSERKELAVGMKIRLGRYLFVVRDIKAGGRKDVNLALSYLRVPSLLGLKSILPRFFQRVFRMRRSLSRVVG
ncbi:MAG: hypothetical protein MUF51_03000 [Vicinamibacteria bacterium]|nr:hypothetical protein [Vicinamibacteria bacterium]